MKPLAVSQALSKLARIRESFRQTVSRDYETKAKDCLTCEVQGVCCTDEHFVNVRVTTLEGEAIVRAVEALPEPYRQNVVDRNRRTVAVLKEAKLSGDEEPGYSCPLFEPGIGCLVHRAAKPLPCIDHACYESPDDLPPAELLEKAEREAALLNNRTYGFAWTLSEIPFWLERLSARSGNGRN